MNDVPDRPTVSIDRISVRGVDADTARRLGPALERSLAEAALSGRLGSGRRARLRLDLASGASPADIARAIARTLERR